MFAIFKSTKTISGFYFVIKRNNKVLYFAQYLHEFQQTIFFGKREKFRLFLLQTFAVSIKIVQIHFKLVLRNENI